ncbi:MAG: hypothetical protein J3K34DRAFT_410599 [Monoraphidium minutum]|nr:MAG: hypothetical protein J3K34DRAFT_410599 [Monoraphidium minutum]
MALPPAAARAPAPRAPPRGAARAACALLLLVLLALAPPHASAGRALMQGGGAKNGPSASELSQSAGYQASELETLRAIAAGDEDERDAYVFSDYMTIGCGGERGTVKPEDVAARLKAVAERNATYKAAGLVKTSKMITDYALNAYRRVGPPTKKECDRYFEGFRQVFGGGGR